MEPLLEPPEDGYCEEHRVTFDFNSIYGCPECYADYEDWLCDLERDRLNDGGTR